MTARTVHDTLNKDVESNLGRSEVRVQSVQSDHISAGTAVSATLEIRLLGELEVLRDAKPLLLPRSKKTRALLAYLVATATTHARSRLCELLWEYPHDPRGSLRWSLTKLRPLLDDAHSRRLIATRDRVGFEPLGCRIDCVALKENLARGVADVDTNTLLDAAALFRGELLEELDMPDCYRFHEWCVAEREALRNLRASVLKELVKRLESSPALALPHARTWVSVDPFAEAAHIQVIRLLNRLGRGRDALQQYESCRRILKNELRIEPSRALDHARFDLESGAIDTHNGPEEREPMAPGTSPAPLIGRRDELEILQDLVARAHAGRSHSPVLLLTGEPGIGKTSLLGTLGDRARAAGGLVLAGRAFEAEMLRPYGVWIDALRSQKQVGLPSATTNDLAPLLPEVGHPGSQLPSIDRNRLFDAVVQTLDWHRRRSGLVCLIIDDLQWLDDASAALLHYVARALAEPRIILACAARKAELPENAAAATLVRALQRDRRLRRIDLEPLDPDDARSLARATAANVDVERVVSEAQGNPLFVIEIARAIDCGQAGDSSERIEQIIDERLGHLGGQAGDLVGWMAAIGRGFDLGLLAQASRIEAPDLLDALDRLDRANVVRELHSGDSDVSYDFVHDVVRQAAYRRLTGPRRRLIHLRLALAMSALDDADATLSAEVAYHAALGGDEELAARACVRAGERCLRVFALKEASELAERGLRSIQRLDTQTRVQLHVDLLKVYVHSTLGCVRARELETELSRLILEAQSAGLHAAVQTGLYLRAVLGAETGDFAGAQREVLRSVEAARKADPDTALRALANTARCLAQLEREPLRAEALLAEAQSISLKLGRTVIDLPWALGLLRHFTGDHDAAMEHLAQALKIARDEGDHWAECECLARMTMIDIECGRLREALSRCDTHREVAVKLGEGSEGAMAAALEALARQLAGEPAADASLEACIARLREIDTKGQLAYVLNHAAFVDLREKRLERARLRAQEALSAAEAVDRSSEVAVALSILARIAAGEGPIAASRAKDVAQERVRRLGAISARARAAVLAASARIEKRTEQSRRSQRTKEGRSGVRDNRDNIRSTADRRSAE